MATRGRKPGFQMSEAHRNKIRNSNILNALVEHVEGRREMSASQVTAGLGLLRKVLPDLSSVESTVTIDDKRDATDWTRDELVAFLNDASNGGEGAAKANRGNGKSDRVH